MKMDAVAKCNPERAFFDTCIKYAEGKYESSSAITEAFKSFCIENKIAGNYNITGFINGLKIPKSRKRIDEDGYKSSEGNPIYVYEGIRLRGKYRVS